MNDNIDKLDLYDISDSEYDFIKLLYRDIKDYPFRWISFMNLITSNIHQVILNSSMIIQFNKLKAIDIELLLSYVIKYNKLNMFEKIIIKKDYIIIHKKSDLIFSFFIEENKWMLIPYYITLKKYNASVAFTSKFFNLYIELKNDIKVILTICKESIDRLSDKILYLTVSSFNNNDSFLKYSYNTEELIQNLLDKVQCLVNNV